MRLVWIVLLLACGCSALEPVGRGEEVDADAVITRENAPSVHNIKLTTIASGFNRPLFATHAGDGSGRLFVVEQSGEIWIVQGRIRSEVPFLDVSSWISPSALTDNHTEQGLLGLAFHPDYKSNGDFFISYTDYNGDTVVARMQVSSHDPDIADTTSSEVILFLPQPHKSHNGGHIAFGPEGYLYISLGDGAAIAGGPGDPMGTGQNRQNLLGSLLRINVDKGFPYAIPADNPFINESGLRGEIWAYGFRNPWRFSFDRATGDMYISDVGQYRWEEVNFEPADSMGGVNYGWNVYEGNEVFAGGEAPNYSPPVFVYGHEHGCSVSGGYVYRGEAIQDLNGVYLFGDWCSGKVWAAWRGLGFNWRVIELLDLDMSISSFGEDEAGELYLIDYGRGKVVRFDPYFPAAKTTREQPPQYDAVTLTRIASGFERPIYATHAGDGTGRLFVLEQSGKIWILQDDQQRTDPFLDVSALISPSALTQRYTEQGLLGLAFHPDYASNGSFFIRLWAEPTDPTRENPAHRCGQRKPLCHPGG